MILENTGDDLKFIIDLHGLNTEQKEAVWSRYWDGKKNPVIIHEHARDEFFFVYSKSHFPGNISRMSNNPTETHGEKVRCLISKPKLEQTVTYKVIGLEAPEEIEFEGHKYRRV